MAIKKPMMNKKPSDLIRMSLFWAVLVFCVLIAAAIFSPQDSLKSVPISDVINRANNGKISKLEIQGNDIKVTIKGKKDPTEKTVKQEGSIQEQGLDADAPVEVTIVPPSTTDQTVWNIAMIIVPVMLIAGFFLIMMRQAQGQNNQAMGFGKSKAKLYGADKEKVVFADVAGNESAKQDLYEVVDFLKHPKKYESLGAKFQLAFY